MLLVLLSQVIQRKWLPCAPPALCEVLQFVMVPPRLYLRASVVHKQAVCLAGITLASAVFQLLVSFPVLVSPVEVFPTGTCAMHNATPGWFIQRVWQAGPRHSFMMLIDVLDPCSWVVGIEPYITHHGGACLALSARDFLLCPLLRECGLGWRRKHAGS